MAWDASDRIRVRGPQLQTLNLSKFCHDGPSLDSSSSFASEQDANMTLGGLLSPIEEEESGFASDSAPLQVKVTVRFLDPVVRPLHYSRTYSSSAAFEPTDRICRGLLRRIEHCSNELITRNDPGALNATLRQTPRFEINYQLRRRGLPGPPEILAERTFRSYQKQQVTSKVAKGILCSTHGVVCVFLRHHDKHFRWTSDPLREDLHDEQSTLKPSPVGAPDLSCVPRSRFIESTQPWEAVPGFTLELVLKSRNPSRRQALITRTMRVDSRQTTPLNLGQGETLLWQAYRTLEDVLDSRRNAFEIEHANCDGFEGVLDCDCQHFDEDALCVELRIVNNLGPCYEHLRRDIQSRLQLFRHVCGNDCDEFMRGVHESFEQLRDKADARLDALNDFDFRVVELIGHGWRIKNPARFILDSKQRHTRHTIGALLDRVRTGIGDVLRGHDVAVRMIAHSRGHLILDKALISRNHQPSPGPFAPATPKDQQALLVAHLKARIQADIGLVCKDTCSLEDIPETPSGGPSERPRNPPSRPFTPRSTVTDALVLTKARSPVTVRRNTTSYTPPGSPGHFAHPPVPRCAAPTSSPMRAFPLVPAKYRENELHSRRTTPSEQDSAAAVDPASDKSMPDEAVSVASLVRDKDNSATSETRQEAPARGQALPALIPAARVFKHSEAEDDDSSSSRSTCSSMPALTESETATPEQSLLITPSQVRHSSPKSHGQFFDDLGYGEPSSPLLLATPDLSGAGYPTANLAAAQGLGMPPKTPVTSTAPAFNSTDEAQEAVSAKTLGSTEAPSHTGGGSTVEEQACSQEADAAPEMRSVLQSGTHDETSSGLGIINDSGLSGHGFDVSGGRESSEAAQRHSRHEGWLLHCVEYINQQQDDAVSENTERLRAIATVAECESSDTLRTQIRILDNAPVEPALPAPQSSPESQEAVAPGLVREDAMDLSDHSEITDTASPRAQGHARAGTTPTRDLSAEEGLSRSKVDYFEADQGTDSEELGDSRSVGALQPAGPSPQLVGDSEPQRTMPYSDPAHGISQRPESVDVSDSTRKHIGFEPTHEAISETLPDLSCSETQHSSLDNTSRVTISAPSDSEAVRGGVQKGPSTASPELNGPVQAADIPSPTDHFALSTPIAPTHGVLPAQAIPEGTPTQGDFVFTSDQANHATSQSLAQTKPTTAPDGLRDNFLLPSLPVFAASLDATANQSRASFQSSSSGWEDCVSEARQSSDSVDTIQQAPSLSDHDVGAVEPPGSPKRLGTPTAGILGLHESRWADFGIRGALTGSHAFDRPSTAPMGSAEHVHQERAGARIEKADKDGEETPRPRPATPHRRSLHLLHHKKSISSIIFPGTHHGHQPHQQGRPPRLRKKESKELGARDKSGAKPKTKENAKPGGANIPEEQDAADAGRFPRAMMLITGLAIASSVVNRSSA